jgi:hypothetical protein
MSIIFSFHHRAEDVTVKIIKVTYRLRDVVEKHQEPTKDSSKLSDGNQHEFLFPKSRMFSSKLFA